MEKYVFTEESFFGWTPRKIASGKQLGLVDQIWAVTISVSTEAYSEMIDNGSCAAIFLIFPFWKIHSLKFKAPKFEQISTELQFILNRTTNQQDGKTKITSFVCLPAENALCVREQVFPVNHLSAISCKTHLIHHHYLHQNLAGEKKNSD